MSDEHRTALAEHVKARRAEADLAQSEAAARCGFSEATLRRVERAEQFELRGSTRRGLERGLGMGDGVVGKILAGTATCAELAEHGVRSGYAARIRDGDVTADDPAVVARDVEGRVTGSGRWSIGFRPGRAQHRTADNPAAARSAAMLDVADAPARPGGQALARATHQAGQALAELALAARTPRVDRSIGLLREAFEQLLDEQADR